MATKAGRAVDYASIAAGGRIIVDRIPALAPHARVLLGMCEKRQQTSIATYCRLRRVALDHYRDLLSPGEVDRLNRAYSTPDQRRVVHLHINASELEILKAQANRRSMALTEYIVSCLPLPRPPDLQKLS